MLNDIKEVLISEEQIRNRIEELGRELSEEYRDKNPLVVGVLKGVVVFYSDMVRKLTVPCQMDFMQISSYAGTATTGEMIVRKDVSARVEGRHVLILEDIYDTGRSLCFTIEHLKAMNPASIKICTLLEKPDRHEEGLDLKPDWVGFVVPNEFVVGYGLDYNEKYRNLPFVGVLKPEVYAK